ncbi:hypothetical protein DV736_g1121, partial [Chaetothyriales sp. CBS 134916]
MYTAKAHWHRLWPLLGNTLVTAFFPHFFFPPSFELSKALHGRRAQYYRSKDNSRPFSYWNSAVVGFWAIVLGLFFVVLLYRWGQTIRKRPRISDLQRHVSSSNVADEHQRAPKADKLPSPSPKRRCLGANPDIAFTMPDRYIPRRTELGEKRDAYRTSKAPSSLRGRELYARSRPDMADPFTSTHKSRSTQIVRRQRALNMYQLRPPHHTPSFVYGIDAGPLTLEPRPGAESLRQLSWSGVWTVGGSMASYFGQLQAVDGGGSISLASGTNATMHTPAFLETLSRDDKVRAQERRLALALNLDQAARVLDVKPRIAAERAPVVGSAAVRWQHGGWIMPHHIRAPVGTRSMKLKETEKNMPTVAFRVLDAPLLKDDFYCSILAYSFTSRTLAVALTHRVYLWTEEYGVRYPPFLSARAANFVTSLAFSSDEGHKSILAVARHNGSVSLWSLFEPRPRFEAPHPFPACCVNWRPVLAYRQSCRSHGTIPSEDLLVGDDSGRIYYYSVEWPEFEAGAMVLLVKLDAHSQNICGLAWSPLGDTFVSGGNDNIALLFKAETVLKQDDQRDGPIPKLGGPNSQSPASRQQQRIMPAGLITPPASPTRDYIQGSHPNLDLFELPGRAASRHGLAFSPPLLPHNVMSNRRVSFPLSPPPPSIRELGGSRSGQGYDGRVLQNGLASPGIAGKMNLHSVSFYHSAAVKAIAFAPWQPSLLATSGGSNDRQIHFHHANSGCNLAVINVFAQVTSLTWSTTRREIVATFGYAQPDHEIRVAVFAWPSCECVVSIPWERKVNGEIGRALWAIPYPGGPNGAVPSRKQVSDGFAA